MATTAVTAIVDEKLSREAAAVLAGIGMTVDEAIKLLLTQVVEQHDFPLSLHIPNEETIEAMRETDRGEGTKYTSLEDLFRDMRG